MKNKVKELLLKAGWTENRKIDISHYLDILDENKYEVFEYARNFLEEYAGLIIKFEHPRRNNTYLDLNLNPINAMRAIYREVPKGYEKHCNETFVIIGEIESMDMTWYISSSGKFYGGYDDSLIFLGGNFFEAFNNIISGAKLEVMRVEYDD